MEEKNYTVKDLVYYLGLFGGVILVFLLTEGWEMHRVVRLLIGGAVGVVLAIILTQVYERMTAPPDNTFRKDD